MEHLLLIGPVYQSQLESPQVLLGLNEILDVFGLLGIHLGMLKIFGAQNVHHPQVEIKRC